MKTLNKIIELSFYSLFFFVPLIFFGNTSELFEFNKMWLAFGLTIVIITAWIIKMVLQRKIVIQKTPLDIPILLFLGSQFASTIFSLDPHISWWGYYSRWNGGFYSTLTYVLLFYAFVSNLQIKQVLRILSVSLVSGLIVAVWAFPAHFGYDPTCFIFRGTLDTSCWTDQFKPTIRTFSTLGQPAWLAAYLALLLPLAISYAFKNSNIEYLNTKQSQNHNDKNTKRLEHSNFELSDLFRISDFGFLILVAFLYINLVFTNTRAGTIGFAVADILLFVFLFFKLSSKKFILSSFIVVHLLFALSSFLWGAPLPQLDQYTLRGMAAKQAAPASAVQPDKAQTAPTPAQTAEPGASGVVITDSAEIRKHVWKGAIDAWKANPVFGTGVETFAFAYYKYKPAEHNLTSEWDYLYNKAHNEYLNYLTTTGAVGLGSYLLMIAWFLFLAIKKLLKWKMENGKWKIVAALIAGYVSILITNFFGFSVVIINLYLFLIPAFVFLLADMLNPDNVFTLGSSVSSKTSHQVNSYQWTVIILLILTSCFMLFSLFWYWYADVKYALGNNLDKVGQYQQAYPLLVEANTTLPNEPVFKDELAINTAVLATALSAQKDEQSIQTGVQFAQNAINLSNDVVTKHPNNVVYWKNRVRVFYTLSDSSPEKQSEYLLQAVTAIDKAAELAPNDAKVLYNQGVLHGQTGDIQKGIQLLERTIQLKPDYKDAYYALGLFYHQLAVDKDGKVVNAEMQKKAVAQMELILQKFGSKDKQIQDTLSEWKK